MSSLFLEHLMDENAISSSMPLPQKKLFGTCWTSRLERSRPMPLLLQSSQKTRVTTDNLVDRLLALVKPISASGKRDSASRISSAYAYKQHHMHVAVNKEASYHSKTATCIFSCNITRTLRSKIIHLISLTMKQACAKCEANLLANNSSRGHVMDLSLLATKADLERTLKVALASGADFAEIYIENRNADTVRIEDRVVVEASRGILLGAGVRCLKDDRVGYAYIDGFDPKQLLEAAKVASEIVSNGGSTLPVGLPQPQKAKSISSPSIFPVELEAAKKIEIARAAEDGARSFDPRIKEALVTVVDYDKSILVANSDGLFVSDRQVVVSLRVIAIAQEDGLRQRGFKALSGSIGYELFDKEDPHLCGREAAQQAVSLLNADEAPAGKMPIVLGNGRGGVLLHEAIGHGFEGDFIRKKTSVFADRIGEKIASPLCTIIDDGGIPGLRGTVNIDDEGTKPKRTVLVENGILKGFIYDIMNARLVGAEPTGNGRRQSYRYIPTVRMTNTFMLPGDTPVDEIIASVSNGLYAKRIGGGQVDITSGNFVFEVLEGYLIENGRVTRPVRGANLIGNGAEILTKIDMVGSDFEFDPGGGSCGKAGQLVPVGNGTPTLRISEITIGGTKS